MTYVIGTAGHVDHGKSSLVQALTGINPDRLAEEQAREMTIDLGFAWMTLPGGESVGIVDVPGHQDFIENMLAGVGGIELVLFVIAADEGVMPQTREHLAILDLLQVPGGVVALTKTDLIEDPDWIGLVTLDIGEALAGITGGSQFFLVLEPQPHLDGRHTVFGQVSDCIDFAANVQPIFDANCVRCHAGANAPRNLRLDSYAGC